MLIKINILIQEFLPQIELLQKLKSTKGDCEQFRHTANPYNFTQTGQTVNTSLSI